MEFTGERVIPGEVDTDLWQEHLARYALAQNWVAGGRVLDAGCGFGGTVFRWQERVGGTYDMGRQNIRTGHPWPGPSKVLIPAQAAHHNEMMSPAVTE